MQLLAELDTKNEVKEFKPSVSSINRIKRNPTSTVLPSLGQIKSMNNLPELPIMPMHKKN